MAPSMPPSAVGCALPPLRPTPGTLLACIVVGVGLGLSLANHGRGVGNVQARGRGRSSERDGFKN